MLFRVLTMHSISVLVLGALSLLSLVQPVAAARIPIKAMREIYETERQNEDALQAKSSSKMPMAASAAKTSAIRKELEGATVSDVAAGASTSIFVQGAFVALVCLVSLAVLCRGFLRSERQHVEEHECLDKEEDAEDGTAVYRSLACLVCCWATCHLSLPTLLFSSHKALLEPFVATSGASGGGDLAVVTLQAAVAVGVGGSLVYDRYGHSFAILYGTAFAASACLAIEYLVSLRSVSPELICWPLGAFIGGATCLHLVALCSAVGHVPRRWVLALGLLMAAGLAEGCQDLRGTYDVDFAAQGPASAIAGFHGLLAMKFASVGLIASAQGAFFASRVQSQRSWLQFESSLSAGQTWTEYFHHGLSSLYSVKLFLAILMQFMPLCFDGLFSSLPRPEQLENILAPWVAPACLAGWAVLLPTWVRLTFPEALQGFVSCACVAALGSATVLEAQLVGLSTLSHPLRAAAGVAMLALGVVAISLEAMLGKEPDCRLRLSSKHEVCLSTLGEAELPMDFALFDMYEADDVKPTFADPLAERFAPDLD